ncbi:ABC transporter permease [Terrisporobacter petrolearius]|uniref:ABC transporter permease n=1 Tax=Terrisporobacter petrolearius TaxID=1460447 RepID=UPI001D1612F8|nr:ABC transporter permease [Terrisporobacter petrolearius]MCC3865467.1 ABC transporter permease [Terrisporobacter petrolearius]
MNFFIGTLEQGLIFAIGALGVYITYTILDFPDLSVDGTFSLGAAITTAFILKDINPFLSLGLAFIGGAIGGLVTGILHVNLKITNLLSGILVMIGLYSINLRVMGKANLPIFNKANIFSNNIPVVVTLLLIVLVVKLLMDILFKTKFGFILRATGDNDTLVTSLGVNKGKMKIAGLMISNGLVALSGAMMAQYQRFSDISMGNGFIVFGLASIILGQSVFKNSRLLKGTTVVIIGAFLYKLSVGVALNLGFPPTDLKLITSLIVVSAIVMNDNNILDKLKFSSKGRGSLNA